MDLIKQQEILQKDNLQLVTNYNKLEEQYEEALRDCSVDNNNNQMGNDNDRRIAELENMLKRFMDLNAGLIGDGKNVLGKK